MLPAADFAATHRVSTAVTRSLSQSTTSYNFLTRPSRQRRKLPLEDLVPKSHAALAARPPAWLEPFAHRASVKKAEESLRNVDRDAIGSDLYLQHMNDRHFMQMQNDAMRVLPERSTRTARLV